MSWLDSLKNLFGKKAPEKSNVTPMPAEADAPTVLRDDISTAPEPEPVTTPLPSGRERRERDRINAPRGTRIMIVDDSPTIVALLRRMLQQNGYEVVDAGDGEKALADIPGNMPDLIFLDIVLPGMNGFEVLRRLRRAAETRQVPVIMISGNELATEQFYAQRIGADDFMKKPFSRSEVFMRIEKLLGPDRMPHRPSQVEGGVIREA